MKKNRKVSRQSSRFVWICKHIASVIALAVGVAFINHSAESSCEELQNEIGRKSRELTLLEDEYLRENARWEEMKSLENLDYALAKHGLKMRVQKPQQIIRMRADGTPYPAQIAVTKIMQRNAMGTTAEYSPRSRHRSMR